MIKLFKFLKVVIMLYIKLVELLSISIINIVIFKILNKRNILLMKINIKEIMIKDIFYGMI